MKNGRSFCISIGKYGGFYFHKDYTVRLCLGWISFTYFPEEIDNILNNLLNKEK